MRQPMGRSYKVASDKGIQYRGSAPSVQAFLLEARVVTQVFPYGGRICAAKRAILQT